MDNEEIQCNRLLAFELSMAIIALLIIIGVIFSMFKTDNQNEEDTEATLETLLISQPISEEPQTANLQAIKTISPALYEGEPLAVNLIEKLTEEEIIIIEEEVIVNPYTEMIENLTDYEKELIYKITFAEAGNQEEDGQRAVIEVILNRVLSDDFPNTVEGVLSQKHQFTTWGRRNKVRQVDQERIVYILELVAIEEPVLPSLEYLFFARGKQTKYATDFIKIQDHWFGATK